MITVIFNLIFYKPLYNALVFIVGLVPVHDVGMAVIILTLIVQLILFPLRHRSIVAQRKMKQIDPEIKKIKEQFKKDKQEQAKQVMALYRSHGISPFSGFLMLLIQLPVFIALYKLFSTGIGFDPGNLYQFISMPSFIKMNFLGLVDISKSNYALAVLAGLTQFFQMKLAMPKIGQSRGRDETFQDQLSRTMNIQSRYIMPALIFFIALKFSSAIALYWTTMNVFAIFHEAVVAAKARRLEEQKRYGTADGKY